MLYRPPFISCGSPTRGNVLLNCLFGDLVLPFKRRFVGTKLNRICCLNKHIFFDLLRASSSSALSAQSNLEAEVELAPRSPNSCVLQLSITRSSHELTVNPNAMIDLTGGEVRTLFLLVPQFYDRKSQSLETGAQLITFLRLNQRQT